jgi:hypothetical protein
VSAVWICLHVRPLLDSTSFSSLSFLQAVHDFHADASSAQQKRVLATAESLQPLQEAFRARMKFHQQKRSLADAKKGTLRQMLKVVIEDILESDVYASLDPHQHDEHELDVQVFR